jgi:hypothetical protein
MTYLEERERCYSILLLRTPPNPLVAFYDIPGRKILVLFFYFVPDTTRDKCINKDSNFQNYTRSNLLIFTFVIILLHSLTYYFRLSSLALGLSRSISGFITEKRPAKRAETADAGFIRSSLQNFL